MKRENMNDKRENIIEMRGKKNEDVKKCGKIKRENMNKH